MVTLVHISIAHRFPSTIYCRATFLKVYTTAPNIHCYVVCYKCHGLYDFQDCMEKVGTTVHAKVCSACLKNKRSIVLLKEIVSSQGNKKVYPYRVYPFCSLISALKVLIKRLKFLVECSRWRQELNSGLDNITNIYNGTVLKELQSFGLLSSCHSKIQ